MTGNPHSDERAAIGAITMHIDQKLLSDQNRWPSLKFSVCTCTCISRTSEVRREGNCSASPNWQERFVAIWTIWTKGIMGEIGSIETEDKVAHVIEWSQ